MNTTLTLILLLSIKHFICDFPLQAFPYQYKNKGTYGHPGGILHSYIHVLGTWIVLIKFTPLWVMYGLLDGFAHYHIDWAKMNINKKFGWGPLTSEWFWVAVGVDQLLHMLTYLFIVWSIV